MSSTAHFHALLLTQSQDSTTQATIVDLTETDLPDQDTLVAVAYSSLNYKDGLAITGQGKIVLQWPMVPGIDFVGHVLKTAHPALREGDPVICTGWGVGETYWGGYSQRQRVKGEWLIPLPAAISPKQAMAIGTAGLTAMLCVMALEDGGVQPDQGPILVTGAAGGVGSVAIRLLSQLGYQVTALSGRPELEGYLMSLGANAVLARETMAQPGRPLDKQTWAGVIDTVGGDILAQALAQTHYRGTVAACGLASSFKLSTTVMPFILRGVRLQGIDSVQCPIPLRQKAWARLASMIDNLALEQLQQIVPLTAVTAAAQAILRGEIKGRVIVDVNQ